MGQIDNKQAANAVIWLLLLTAPFWMQWVGGYTELGSRVLVYALAAMALNFLLGFTGVLSFGHAAYFGLGAYGAAMAIKYLVPSTLFGMLIGVLVGTAAAALIGPLIVKLRGVYFAMVTIAFGQVFYFITFRWNTVTGGDDGVNDWHRMPIEPPAWSTRLPAAVGTRRLRRGLSHLVTAGLSTPLAFARLAWVTSRVMLPRMVPLRR